MPKSLIVQFAVSQKDFYLFNIAQRRFLRRFVCFAENCFSGKKRKEKYPSKTINQSFFNKAGLFFLNKNKNCFMQSEEFEKQRKTEYNKDRKRKRRRNFFEQTKQIHSKRSCGDRGSCGSCFRCNIFYKIRSDTDPCGTDNA